MRAAVLGSPIAHSLSPVLHRAAYAHLGLDWSYSAIEVSVDGFWDFWAGLDGSWGGLSLTMPLKEVVIPLLEVVDPVGAATGAVNTVTFGDRVASGYNTDVHGILAALETGGAVRASSAVVLGAGATARSAVAALAQLGVLDLTVLSRDVSRSQPVLDLARGYGMDPVWAELTPSCSLKADVVVCTLPGAAAGSVADSLSSASGVLLDVSYHPWPTPLASAWEAAGGVAVGGFTMLLHQAARQVELMTGLEAPVTAMEGAGLAELSARG